MGSVLQGLWRVDDHDIARLAAVTRSPQKQTSASTAEEGRGPHVALSVRLKRKDPDRQFHIGERIPYVLMANSSKLQVFSYSCQQMAPCMPVRVLIGEQSIQILNYIPIQGSQAQDIGTDVQDFWVGRMIWQKIQWMP